MIRALQYLWTVPHTLLGLLMLLLYVPRSLRWRDGALEATSQWIFPWWWNVGAQTWGWLIIYKNEYQRGREDLQNHERWHIIQAFRWGPLFLLAYPLASLVALFKGRHFYRDNCFEVEAYDNEYENPL